MPHIQLTPQDDGGVRLGGGRQPPVYLPKYRLRVWVRVGTDPRARQAVLDTGAPAAVFSRLVWEPFADRGEIEWLCYPPEEAKSGQLPRTRVLGSEHRYRLGRMVIQPVDLDRSELTPTRIPVQCLEDNPLDSSGQPRRLLVLGLNGLLHGRTLTVSASTDGAAWAAALAE